MPFVQRLLGTALAIVFLAAAVLAASLAIGVALGFALIAWIWLWWRGRSAGRGRTIEGQFRDVSDLERLQERQGERL